jgi:hypothetical protein
MNKKAHLQSVWLQKSDGTMKKLATPLQAARLVKSSDKLWYIDFYDDAGKRQRLKQGMNRIHDLKARELYANKIIRQLNGQPIELPLALPPSVIQVNLRRTSRSLLRVEKKYWLMAR